MHFNIHKTCIPLYYNDEGVEDVTPVENENGNVWVRKAIGVQMIKECEQVSCPCINRGNKEVSLSRQKQIQCT